MDRISESAPLNFSLSSRGISVTGFTDDPEELVRFANRLIEVAQVIPARTKEAE